MTAVRLYRFILLVLGMVLATFALGWAGVLFAAVAFALIDRGERVPWETARAAAIAWGCLLIVDLIPSMFSAAAGPSMVRIVGAAMGMPLVVAPLVTLVFPGLLAWSGATVTVALLRLAGRPRMAPIGARVEA